MLYQFPVEQFYFVPVSSTASFLGFWIFSTFILFVATSGSPKDQKKDGIRAVEAPVPQQNQLSSPKAGRPRKRLLRQNQRPRRGACIK